MLDKGYPFPLYSLDLLPPECLTGEQAHYSIPAPQGALVVSDPGLLPRGERYRVPALERAIDTALALRRAGLIDLDAFGLDGAWTDSLQHWRQRMVDADGERVLARDHADRGARAREELRREGAGLWRLLCTAARLAGLGDELLPGAVPRGQEDLLRGLKIVAERLADPALAARLARFGLSPARAQELQAFVASAERALTERALAAQALRRCGGALTVMRAALVGDLLRLCAVTRRVLPDPDLRHSLSLPRLLGERPPPRSGRRA